MDTLVPDKALADKVEMSPERFDQLVAECEALCTLSLDRTMFTPTEVMDLMLDVRAILVEARRHMDLALATPVG